VRPAQGSDSLGNSKGRHLVPGPSKRQGGEKGSKASGDVREKDRKLSERKARCGKVEGRALCSGARVSGKDERT